MPEAGFRIAGRVQGVGFRWWTLGVARDLNLDGWVRNAPDGSVEVAARGPQAKLSELRLRLSQGPPAARVESVREVELSGCIGQGFQIAG